MLRMTDISKVYRTELIETHGPFEIHGDPEILRPLDELLRAFVAQRRMKLVGEYKPCYRVVA